MNNPKYRCEFCSADHTQSVETCNFCGRSSSVFDQPNDWLTTPTIILTLLSFLFGFCLFFSLHGGIMQLFKSVD